MRRMLAIATLLLGSTACNGPQSTLHPGGPAAGNLATIGWTVYILFGAVALTMWILLAWAATRHRGSLATHQPWDTGGGQRWILIGGFAIPFVVLSAVFVFAMERMTDFPVRDPKGAAPEILVIGHQWWWEVRYIGGPPNQQFTTANEIHIPSGRPVNIALETHDVIHSFWVPGLHGKVDMIPGQPNYIRVQADHPREFKGECGEYCGAEHARMRLLVVAQDPQAYEEWKQGQLKPAAPPTSPESARGQQVFLDGACALCHQVRGTEAAGLIGPDLTHLASRKGIAANYYPNNKANLEAWVTHAQSLKPGAVMPNLTQFSGTDLRALVAYLEQLK